MAKEGPGGERTERATGKKRRTERKKGHVAMSNEIVTATFILVVFFVIRLSASLMLQTGENVMTYWLSIAGNGMSEDGQYIDGLPVGFKLVIETVKAVALSTGAVLLVSGIASMIPTFIQTRFLVSFERMKPKLSKLLNPFPKIKAMFSVQKLVELAINLVKFIILAVILFDEIRGRLPEFARLYNTDFMPALAYMGSVVWAIIMKVAIAFIIIAVIDLFFRRWKFEEDMKMTKQEVKEEFKNMEGDPKIKSKRRSIQQRMAMQRMMKAIPEADVIIRNPTHFAVALKYTAAVDKAPIVIAKGQDFVALKIIEIAEEHNVALVENRPLARALFESTQIDKEIPAKFFQACAEVLAFVYKMKKGEPAEYVPTAVV
ncbi:MAG: flagellar biosynthesis protein FlhB [Ruminococcus sp.]|jgi:flagellar biosynthetic protein FlhB|nr:flagellar biosynthesis protein FlhB [Ruminococcus sp.]